MAIDGDMQVGGERYNLGCGETRNETTLWVERKAYWDQTAKALSGAEEGEGKRGKESGLGGDRGDVQKVRKLNKGM